jgi:hypothetical protein
MAKLITVYRALPADVSKVVGHLEERCLHPVVVDEPEPAAAYRRQAHEIRIAVPETESDMAFHILREHQQRDEQRLAPLVRTTNTVVILLVVALALLAVVGLLDARGWWFLGLSILFVIAAGWALVRGAWRRTPRA